MEQTPDSAFEVFLIYVNTPEIRGTQRVASLENWEILPELIPREFCQPFSRHPFSLDAWTIAIISVDKPNKRMTFDDSSISKVVDKVLEV